MVELYSENQLNVFARLSSYGYNQSIYSINYRLHACKCKSTI